MLVTTQLHHQGRELRGRAQRKAGDGRRQRAAHPRAVLQVRDREGGRDALQGDARAQLGGRAIQGDRVPAGLAWLRRHRGGHEGHPRRRQALLDHGQSPARRRPAGARVL